jgi:small conductance mechanosensitive channel
MMLKIAMAVILGLWLATQVNAQLPHIERAIEQNTTTTTQPATQASTQPVVNVTVNTADNKSAEPQTIVEAFSRTRLGEIIQGKLKINLRDVKDIDFWLKIVLDLGTAILSFIPRLIACIIFLFVFYFLYRLIRRLAVRNMNKANVDSSIRHMIGGLLRWLIMGFGVVIACNQLGIPIVAMLTGVSIIGLAIGFAAQETLANFIAGIVIFLDKPFKIGDWIEVEDQQGSVTRVTFRSTRFTNLDGDVVVLPNTAMLQNRIINKTTNLITRVNVPIGISYSESIDRAREVLLGTLKDDPRISAYPVAEVEVRECAASSVNLILHFWISEERYEDAMVWEYLEKCKNALDAAGVEIPFPHMQVLLDDKTARALRPGGPDDKK